jgi:hypothetical protein
VCVAVARAVRLYDTLPCRVIGGPAWRDKLTRRGVVDLLEGGGLPSPLGYAGAASVLDVVAPCGQRGCGFASPWPGVCFQRVGDPPVGSVPPAREGGSCRESPRKASTPSLAAEPGSAYRDSVRSGCKVLRPVSGHAVWAYRSRPSGSLEAMPSCDNERQRPGVALEPVRREPRRSSAVEA